MRMAFGLFNSVASLPPPPLVNPNLTTSSFIGLNHNIIPTITKKHHKIIFFLSTSRSLFSSAAIPSQGNTEGQETSKDDTPAPLLSPGPPHLLHARRLIYWINSLPQVRQTMITTAIRNLQYDSS